MLETLGLSEEVLRATAPSKKGLKRFLGAAQGAWDAVRDDVNTGGLNFISWLRGLLAESYEAKVWIPSGVIKRLRQFERGELEFRSASGPHQVPVGEGLPAEFKECCECMGWRFRGIVKRWDGKHEDIYTNLDETWFVEAVCRTWRQRPDVDNQEELEEFIVAELKQRGFTVTQIE